MDYSGICDTVFYSELEDLDLEVLKRKGYTYDTYFPEADDMAAFIVRAYADGKNIIVSANTVIAEVRGSCYVRRRLPQSIIPYRW